MGLIGVASGGGRLNNTLSGSYCPIVLVPKAGCLFEVIAVSVSNGGIVGGFSIQGGGNKLWFGCVIERDKRQETKRNNDCDKSKQNKKISSREKANPSSTHKIKRCDENQERAASKMHRASTSRLQQGDQGKMVQI